MEWEWEHNRRQAREITGSEYGRPFMNQEAISGFELSSDIETEDLTAMLGMDNGKVGQRLIGI